MVFQPRLEILPAAQRRLWAELTALPSHFTLYGGTAIALRLGHRQSVDFDFFSGAAFDPRTLAASLPFLADATITQIEPNTLSAVVERGGPVKVSFFGLPGFPRLAPPDIAENDLKIASLLDLAGTKTSVVQVRAEAKDYLDIDAMLVSGLTLLNGLAAGKALYGAAFAPQATLKALTYFNDGDLATLPLPLRARLVATVKALDLALLPDLRPIGVL